MGKRKGGKFNTFLASGRIRNRPALWRYRVDLHYSRGKRGSQGSQEKAKDKDQNLIVGRRVEPVESIRLNLGNCGVCLDGR